MDERDTSIIDLWLLDRAEVNSKVEKPFLFFTGLALCLAYCPFQMTNDLPVMPANSFNSYSVLIFLKESTVPVKDS